MLSNRFQIAFKLILNCFQIVFELPSNRIQIAFKSLSNYLKIAFKLFSNCFQIAFKLLSNRFQIAFRLFPNWFQIAFKLLSNRFQIAFKLLPNWFQICFNFPKRCIITKCKIECAISPIRMWLCYGRGKVCVAGFLRSFLIVGFLKKAQENRTTPANLGFTIAKPFHNKTIAHLTNANAF